MKCVMMIFYNSFLNTCEKTHMNIIPIFFNHVQSRVICWCESIFESSFNAWE